MADKQTEDGQRLAEKQRGFIQTEYDCLIQADFVKSTYARNSDLLSFLVATAAHAYIGKTFYHPAFPPLVSPHHQPSDDIAFLKSALQNMVGPNNPQHLSSKEIIDLHFPMLEQCTSDEELHRRHQTLYQFLCFTSNFHNLLFYPRKFGVPFPAYLPHDAQGAKATSYKENVLFKIKHVLPSTSNAMVREGDPSSSSPDRKRRRQDADATGKNATDFVKSNSTIVFHGTQMNKLYSLIRNGPITLSHVRHGRVYGDGFYCSGSFKVATSYSNSFVCVYLLKNHRRYAKTPDSPVSVYVVEDGNDLLLTHVVPCITPQDVLQSIVDELNADLIRKEAEVSFPFSSSVSGAGAGAGAGERTSTRAGAGAGEGGSVRQTNQGNRRLPRDLKKTKKEFEEEHPEQGIRFELVENDMTKWRVYMKNFPEDTALYKDMVDMGVSEIVFEMEFPDNYPISPPFIRVVRPRFRQYTGHVTTDGALCAEFLTVSNSETSWTPICSIPFLLLSVKTLVCENGRLEKMNVGDTEHHRATQEQEAYERNAAKRSFEITAKNHGWTM